MGELKSSETHWVVNAYIGVSGGYLGDFTYRTHREFYPAFCDLDLDPDTFPGNTTRERFLNVLASVDAPSQAAILRGVARKYPEGSEVQRTPASHQKLLELTKRCADSASVNPTNPRITSEVVRRALADASTLIIASGPTSAVDRVHTALHAYLKAVCQSQALSPQQDATMTQLFKMLRQQHPRLSDLGNHDETMARIFQSLANIIDSLNPARNRGSLAHANEQLLEKDDAILVINAARSIFQYLDAKLS